MESQSRQNVQDSGDSGDSGNRASYLLRERFSGLIPDDASQSSTVGRAGTSITLPITVLLPDIRVEIRATEEDKEGKAAMEVTRVVKEATEAVREDKEAMEVVREDREVTEVVREVVKEAVRDTVVIKDTVEDKVAQIVLRVSDPLLSL